PRIKPRARRPRAVPGPEGRGETDHDRNHPFATWTSYFIEFSYFSITSQSLRYTESLHLPRSTPRRCPAQRTRLRASVPRWEATPCAPGPGHPRQGRREDARSAGAVAARFPPNPRGSLSTTIRYFRTSGMGSFPDRLAPGSPTAPPPRPRVHPTWHLR